MSDSLQPHGWLYIRLPCPSPSPGVCSNSCPSSQWCHPAISFSVTPFSLCLQSFPASGSFLVSWLFVPGGENIVTSASVLSMNSKCWFPLGLTRLILQSKKLSRSFPAPQFKSINSLALSLLYGSTLISVHDYWKTIALDLQAFFGKVMSLLCNTLSRLIIAFLQRSNHFEFQGCLPHLQLFWSPRK